MSYELIDSEKLNQLILSIEVLNEQVRELSNKSKITEKVKLENCLEYKTN
mgnify:CR=1 FL=1